MKKLEGKSREEAESGKDGKRKRLEKARSWEEKEDGQEKQNGRRESARGRGLEEDEVRDGHVGDGLEKGHKRLRKKRQKTRQI